MSAKSKAKTKTKTFTKVDPAALSPAVQLMMPHLKPILEAVGEDPKREGLHDTPKRFSKAMDYLTSGYRQTVTSVVGQGIFKAESSEMVIVKNIELYSLCEHHMLPFYGKAHVGYIPDKKIIGLSKIPRIVDLFARRLQVQERLTAQVADALMEVVNPLGVAVVIEASHFCMMMRGVEKQNSQTITSAMRGDFYHDSTTRKEFLELIRG
jgi:GTP cyclohydrolase IA